MKILLINPPFYKFFKQKSAYFPKGLGYLGQALIQAGHEVKIYNADDEDSFFLFFSLKKEIKNLNDFLKKVKNPGEPVFRKIIEAIDNYQPEIIGISATTANFASSCTLSRQIKKIFPGVKIVFGGIHPTVRPEDALKFAQADLAVRGEGERTFVELVDKLGAHQQVKDLAGLSYLDKNGCIVINALPPLAENCNVFLPLTTNLLINPSLDTHIFGRIITSRGCPFNCSFCASHKIWGRRVRYRSVQNVMDEIKGLKKEYGLTHFFIDDDTFALNREFVKEFCQEMIKNQFKITWWCETRIEVIDQDLVKIMAKAGCTTVALGIESGSEKVLEKINKKFDKQRAIKVCRLLQRFNIEVDAFFLTGFPFEEPEDVKASIDYLRQLKPNYAWLAIVVPYPGTQLFEDYRKEFIEPIDWSGFLHFNPAIAYQFNKNLSPQERLKLLSYIVNSFEKYNRWQAIKKYISKFSHPWKIYNFTKYQIKKLLRLAYD